MANPRLTAARLREELGELAPLLDQLGQIHRAQCAPAALHASVLERLERGTSGVLPADSPAQVSPTPAFVRVAWLPIAVAAAVYLCVKLWPSEPPAAAVAVGAEPPAGAVAAKPAGTADDVDLLLAHPDCPPYIAWSEAANVAGTTDADLAAAGLSVRAFTQQSTLCGPLTRRYLEYVPARLPPESPAPVLLLLHSGPDKAEGLWRVQTERSFDAIADRDQIITVYANALPSEDSDANVPNEGRWQTSDRKDVVVDEEEYLLLIIEDLVRRGVIDGSNDVFLVGLAEGAAMALQAAANRPDFYAGVAAFMPYMFTSEPPERRPGARLRRVLFVTLDGIGVPMARQWALALGVPSPALEQASEVELPDRVVEGKGYAGDSPVLRATGNSRVFFLDMFSAEPAGARVRVLNMMRAGHFWPKFEYAQDQRLLEAFGWRNQDIDGADEAWDFLKNGQ